MCMNKHSFASQRIAQQSPFHPTLSQRSVCKTYWQNIVNRATLPTAVVISARPSVRVSVTVDCGKTAERNWSDIL